MPYDHALLRGLLDLASKETLTPRELRQLGGQFEALEWGDIAGICYGAGAKLAQERGDPIGAELRRLQAGAPGTSRDDHLAAARRVVADAFFTPMVEPELGPRPNRRRPRCMPTRPTIASMAGYAKWAKIPLTNLLCEDRTILPGHRYVEVLEARPKTRFKNRDYFSVGESTFKVDV